MGFKVAVIYYSVYGRLVTLANVIAEGARRVHGADVTVFRIQDPIKGDDPKQYEEGVLEAPIVTIPDIIQADAIIMGAPGRQGGMCGEMRLFLDSLAGLQGQHVDAGFGALKGKVASAFTSVGGHNRGFGGHEAILQSFHSTFFQHGMVVVGNPPSATMEDANMGTPFGVVMGGKEPAYGRPTLSESEVKLAFAMGEWTAQITRLLHDSDE